jgi:hypothetical protein
MIAYFMLLRACLVMWLQNLSPSLAPRAGYTYASMLSRVVGKPSSP